eukprot:jgi/Botrbrau1/5191/Bobra.0172s0060.2
MSTYTVNANGKRVSVKAGPMQLVRAILDQACAQLKPPAEPADCKLMLGQMALPLDEPIRYANIPSGAQLMLITGQEPVLGVRSSSGSSPASKTLTSGVTHPPSTSLMSVPPAQPPALSAAAPARMADATPASLFLEASGSQDAADSQTLAAQDEGLASAEGVREKPNADTLLTPVPEQDSNPPTERGSGSQLADIDRPIYVFTREAAAASETSARPMEEDVGADFYEFTAEDYHRVMAGYSRQRQAGEKGLRTSKLREAEEAERAARLGPVTLRIAFPDGTIVQAEFKATETLEAVRNFVASCVRKDVQNWYLYTAPPKQVIKDWSVTLFRAGLVPAALVFCGPTEGSPCFLKSSLMELREKGVVPSRSEAHQHEVRPFLSPTF